MNRICLIGRITKDPELKYTNNNKEYCNFTIAVQRQVKDANGDRQSDFIYCIAWNQTAKFLCTYIKKGYNLAIDGRLQINQYQKDGQNVTSAQVVCDSVESLTTKAEIQAQGQQVQQRTQATPQANNSGYNTSPNNYNQTKQKAYNQQPSNTQAQKQQEQQSFNVNVVDDDLPF